MRRRYVWHLLERLLVVVSAFCWFGNTGLGLSLLLLATRSGPLPAPHLDAVFSARIRSAWVGTDRVLVRCARQGRLEVFRDEVSEAEWAALRRFVLAATAEAGAQPATGRSTSI